jgi:hypothetical protein
LWRSSPEEVEEVEDIKITRRRMRKRVLEGEDIGAGGVDMRKEAVNGGQVVGSEEYGWD